jgi:hypothetical protein
MSASCGNFIEDRCTGSDDGGASVVGQLSDCNFSCVAAPGAILDPFRWWRWPWLRVLLVPVVVVGQLADCSFS